MLLVFVWTQNYFRLAPMRKICRNTIFIMKTTFLCMHKLLSYGGEYENKLSTMLHRVTIRGANFLDI